jgi:hypothetical protein
MKRIIITALLLCLCFFSKAQLFPCESMSFTGSLADVRQGRVQPQHPGQDEIESRKIAWLATAVVLTPAEAARFWPVYNEWSKKLEENMKTRHVALRKIRQLSRDKSVDEKIYAQQSKVLIDGAAEEARMTSEAHQSYVSILGEVRTAKLYLAEEQFREMLIRELRQGSGAMIVNRPRQ